MVSHSLRLPKKIKTTLRVNNRGKLVVEEDKTFLDFVKS